jgi:SAM-dependent methyltransferase
MLYRNRAYAKLRGKGLEVGALHQPAQLPSSAEVVYFDAQRKSEAVQLFKEIPAESIVDPHFVGNLDADGLMVFPDGTFDFVIICHVIEHLSNPLFAIRETFRVLRTGGLGIIAVPDKRYTFDKLRENISWEHLLQDYQAGTKVSSDEHYIDFLKSAHADIFPQLERELPLHVAHARSRREHTHAWDSPTFRDHLTRTLSMFGIQADPVEESAGEENQFEYFGVWKKRT